MWSKMYWMIGTAVVTMPEGMVKGPERVLPKKSVFKVAGSSLGGNDGAPVQRLVGPHEYNALRLASLSKAPPDGLPTKVLLLDVTAVKDSAITSANKPRT
jgi:hypothetical protein